MDILRGVIGIIGLIGITFLFSTNKKKIDWKLVGIGIFLQLIFAILILKVPFVRMMFEYVASLFTAILNFTDEGATFIFGNLVDPEAGGWGYIFAFKVLPTIVFFSAFTAILFYLGILQKIVYAFAVVLSKAMGLSGPESLAAAGNIFLGQTESPLLIRHYLDGMTRSEMMALMAGGMATIAGGVFAAFIGFLGGDDPAKQLEFATHLLSASIMSAPAAIVAAKILVPETEHDKIQKDLSVPQERIGANVLDAITKGTTDGLSLAVNVGAMLLVFVALIAMANGILFDLIGGNIAWGGMSFNDHIVEWSGGKFTGFRLQTIFGLLFAPFAWLLGVPNQDIFAVGQLLGEKTVINEFVAYISLGEMTSNNVLDPKSVLIATYALCGFSNFSSIGIQIGGIGALAPNQRVTLSELGILALIGGTVACFMTATIAGMIATV